jgi:uncharacterized protein DUF2059
MLASLIAALVALAAAAPAQTAQPAATASADTAPKLDPATKQAALKLASILYSEESQVSLAERVVDTQLAPTFRADENFKVLEREYPGFTDDVLRQLKPALVRFTRSSLPEYHDRVATLLGSVLSKEDIEDLSAFYVTPTGKKLLAGMAENGTLETVLAETTKDPEKPTSLAALAKDHDAAVAKVAKSMDASDQAALREFSNKPYYFQLALLGPAMRKLEQDFANEPAPEFEKQIGTIMETTAARFKAAKEAGAK